MKNPSKLGVFASSLLPQTPNTTNADPRHHQPTQAAKLQSSPVSPDATLPIAALKSLLLPTAMNATVAAVGAAGGAGSAPVSYPFYHLHRAEVIPGLPDVYVSVIAPFVAYWVMSLFFHAIDKSEWSVFEKYRIHESEEVKTKNRVTVKQVINMVLLQQVFQTILGLVWLEEDNPARGPFRDHAGDIASYSLLIANVAVKTLGPSLGQQALKLAGPNFAGWLYWWGVPIAQYLFAALVLDTWQYFWHRYFHVNLFLYRHIHSWHHRLYVPYAFGALYNHPVEGFILDTLGAVIAHSCSLMSTRQGIVFFALSTAKTVDDHCGFAFPWDPMQHLFGNNSDYHDIHHQIGGLKSNFSQPYFIHFDYLFGTRMTRTQFLNRKNQRPKRSLPSVDDSPEQTQEVDLTKEE